MSGIYQVYTMIINSLRFPDGRVGPDGHWPHGPSAAVTPSRPDFHESLASLITTQSSPVELELDSEGQAAFKFHWQLEVQVQVFNRPGPMRPGPARPGGRAGHGCRHAGGRGRGYRDARPVARRRPRLRVSLTRAARAMLARRRRAGPGGRPARGPGGGGKPGPCHWHAIMIVVMPHWQ